MVSKKIKSVLAREAYSDAGYPAVEVTVTSDCGDTGLAYNTENYSTGSYHPVYLYDKEERFDGFGVTKAADIINKYIAPRLVGLDLDNRALIDSTIKAALRENGIPNYVNVSSPVSVAAFKAAAVAKKLPLFRHVGGQSAFTLPVGSHLCASGCKRYSNGMRAQEKPIYFLAAYDFPTFAQAHYALWETVNIYEKLLAKKYGFLIHRGFSMAINAGKMDHDEFLWKVFVESIETAGYTGKVGISINIGANEYYNSETGLYEGLFSAEPKSKEALMDLYVRMTTEYPFIMLMDPFEENDLESFARLRAKTKAKIVGADLCCANLERIKECVRYGCVDSVMLCVNEFETVSDAINAVCFAKNFGVDVLPRDACGESLDVVAYAVGFNAGTIYEGGLDIISNELLLLEEEIGEKAKFYARAGMLKK